MIHLCSNFVHPSSLGVLLSEEVACHIHRVEVSGEKVLQHSLCTSQRVRPVRAHMLYGGEVEAVLAGAHPGLREDGHPVAAPLQTFL